MRAALHCSTLLVQADLYHDRFRIVMEIYASGLWIGRQITRL
jgi:hypothetical protein